MLQSEILLLDEIFILDWVLSDETDISVWVCMSSF